MLGKINSAFIAFVLFMMSLIIAIPVFAQVSEPALIMTLTTDKQVYEYGDQVEMTLEAENVSGGLMQLSFGSGCQMTYTLDQYVSDRDSHIVPVYNEYLNPRNCDDSATELELPDGQKAIWSRTYNAQTSILPVLAPGEYVVHGFLTGYQAEDWSDAVTSYTKFTVQKAADQEEGGYCNWDSDVMCNNDLGCYFQSVYYEDGGVCLDITVTGGEEVSRDYSLTVDPQVFCDGTGGTYLGCVELTSGTVNEPGEALCEYQCDCPVGYEWDLKLGCQKEPNIAELCMSTGGIVLKDNLAECYCGQDMVWDFVRGCNVGAVTGFNDIEGHWGEEYIVALARKGIVKGYEDGGFHPNEFINRAELVKMALSAAEIEEDLAYFSDFTFEDLDDWQKPWVNAAFKQEIVQGYSENIFAPAQNVTRTEALKIAMLSFEVEIPATSDEWAFKDTIDHWGVSYINQAYLDFIVSGREDGLFYPNDPITRAEAAKVLKLLIDKY